MILLAEHDKPTLAAKKKQQQGAWKTATSTPKNRVWGFENYPSGRTCSDPDLSAETATGSVQFTYKTASGRGDYYSRDHLGSVRELMNGSGTIQARYGYDSYGRTTLVSGTNLATKQYAGMYAHQTSGLYLTKGGTERPYDAGTGRWLSRDPIEENGGINLYDYVENNPILNRDPFGTIGRTTNKDGSSTIVVEKCEIAIIVGHGDFKRPHTVKLKSPCSAAGAIMCGASGTNRLIPGPQLVPGSPIDDDWDGEMYSGGPEYLNAYAAMLQGARDIAKTMTCCKQVKIYSVYAPSGDFITDLWSSGIQLIEIVPGGAP